MTVVHCKSAVKGGRFMRVTFASYPSILQEFKEKCELNCVSMSQKIEMLTRDYLNKKIGDITDLMQCLKEVKSTALKENKSQKLSIQIDEVLYEKLKENLKETSTRPASFFTLAMAFYLMTGSKQEDYRKRAERLINEINDGNIKHVVYALKYYKPTSSGIEFCHLENFIDCCDDNKFREYYQEPNSPFIEVLAVHK